MDLSAIKLVDTAMPMVLKDLDDEPMEHDGKPVTFLVYGRDSNAYKNVEQEIANKRIQKIVKKRGNLGASFDTTAEENEKTRLKSIAACIAGWDNVFEDGAPLAFTPQEAHRLVSNFPVIADQVEAFATERANFIKK